MLMCFYTHETAVSCLVPIIIQLQLVGNSLVINIALWITYRLEGNEQGANNQNNYAKRGSNIYCSG